MFALVSIVLSGLLSLIVIRGYGEASRSFELNRMATGNGSCVVS
jgi:hypothetical protein